MKINKFLRNASTGIKLFRREFEGRLADANRVIDSIQFIQETVERAKALTDGKILVKTIKRNEKS